MIVAGQTTWENNWCYLKDPAADYAGAGLLVDQERHPAWRYEYCIDCKDSAIKDALCTFGTNYFTTHAGSNITCPARSESVTRSIGGFAAKAQFIGSAPDA